MDANEMYEKMKSKLSRIVPDVELRYKAEIAVEINELKVSTQCGHPGAQLHGTSPVPFHPGFHR